MHSTRFCSEIVNQSRYGVSALRGELLRRLLRRQNFLGPKQCQEVITRLARFLVTLRSSQIEPDIRANAIFCRPLSLPVHHTQSELRFGIAAAGSPLQPLARHRETLQRTATIVIHGPELRLSRHQTLFCRTRDPLSRERGVATCASPVQVREPKLQLCFRYPLCRIRFELGGPDHAFRIHGEGTLLDWWQLRTEGS